jgi:hypothetical protein
MQSKTSFLPQDIEDLASELTLRLKNRCGGAEPTIEDIRKTWHVMSDNRKAMVPPIPERNFGFEGFREVLNFMAERKSPYVEPMNRALCDWMDNA